MFLRQLDLTTALRPLLHDDESLLFVQDGVGLYEGRFKIPNYQNGHIYLTSHRICYVDNQDPRKYSVAVELKDIDKTEFYAGFLKSSPKITIFPKPTATRRSQSSRSAVPRYASPQDALLPSPQQPARSVPSSPAPSRDPSATWICPICGLSNPVPANFDPAAANQHTPLPPCQACGIKPPLSLLLKISIASRTNRPNGASHMSSQTGDDMKPDVIPTGGSSLANGTYSRVQTNVCPRCTFQNHPSISTCEMCGAILQNAHDRVQSLATDEGPRAQSPGPTRSTSIIGDDSIETIKLSFRAGGEKLFHERVRTALVQRKWLLQSAPPVPKPPGSRPSGDFSAIVSEGVPGTSMPQQRIVGIAGLERRGAELRQNNQTVIGTAFEDLEALMTSAKEVIAMAEEFAKRTHNDSSVEDRALVSASESALGLITTKDMLGGGTAAENLYITELSRNLAEFLTDDRRSILRREGGVMSLMDLWAVFNRTRKGVELISPLDFERAARTWDSLSLPIRLRRFKSGLLVVQERSRSDEKTIASLLAWLREAVRPPLETGEALFDFGKGVTAQETAEKFGWSVGVADEELEMAEENGALCRDQCLDGTRFWKNHFGNWMQHDNVSATTAALQGVSI